MSATAVAHGMDGTLVEPDWPPLSAEEVARAAAPVQWVRWADRDSVGEPAAIFGGECGERRGPSECLSSGITRTVRDRGGIAARSIALWITCGLEARQCRRCLRPGSGETAIESGEWTYEVHEAPPGIDLYEDAISWTPFRRVHHARSAGQALARLHLAAEGFEAAGAQGAPAGGQFHDLCSEAMLARR